MSFRLLVSPALPWQEVHLIKFTLEVSTTFLFFFWLSKSFVKHFECIAQKAHSEQLYSAFRYRQTGSKMYMQNLEYRIDWLRQMQNSHRRFDGHNEADSILASQWPSHGKPDSDFMLTTSSRL